MASSSFLVKLSRLQPSQLYISRAKLECIRADAVGPERGSVSPIPVLQLGDDVILTDGHTRAYAAFLLGVSEVEAYWDEDELDLEAYGTCVAWCKQEGIESIADLRGRVLPQEEYETLWLRRCEKMQQELEQGRYQG
jgi:hypothetical protein